MDRTPDEHALLRWIPRHKLARTLALDDSIDQQLKGIAGGGARPLIELIEAYPVAIHHEQQLVVCVVLFGEGKVLLSHGAQARQRGGLGERAHQVGREGERPGMDRGTEQRVLVSEVAIDRGGGDPR